MPISITTDPSGTERGFTLVELMVVIFIVGLASAAVIMVARPSGQNVRNDAEQLAARVAALRDHAILQSRPLAIWVRASGYGFEARSKGAWQPITQAPFKADNWREGTVAQLSGGRPLRIAFDSSGMPTNSTAIALTGNGAKSIVTVSATGDVHVTR